MAMVPYDRDAYWRMYEMDYCGWSGEEMARDNSKHNGPRLSNRLQALLQIAREANEMGEQRLPLEEVLARLRQERETAIAAQEKAIKLSVAHFIEDTLMNTLQNVASPQSEAAPVSQATQVNLESAYVQQLLANATDEAYECGFLAGRYDGIKEGVKFGRLMGELDGLIAGRLHGRAEGLEEERKLALQRGIEIEKQHGRDDGVAEGMKTGDSELGLRPANVIANSTQMNEKVAVKMPPAKPLVKLPPVSRKALPKPDAKENKKPVDDPFQSLLGLVQRKKSG